MLQEFKTIVASTTAVVGAVAGRNVKLHTIVCPKATVGTVTVTDGTTSYFVLPAGSIGTFIFDAVFSNGLQISLSSASDTAVLATIATY